MSSWIEQKEREFQQRQAASQQKISQAQQEQAFLASRAPKLFEDIVAAVERDIAEYSEHTKHDADRAVTLTRKPSGKVVIRRQSSPQIEVTWSLDAHGRSIDVEGMRYHDQTPIPIRMSLKLTVANMNGLMVHHDRKGYNQPTEIAKLLIEDVLYPGG